MSGLLDVNLGAASHPIPQQRAAILDDHRFLLLVAGTRGGKTWAGARAFFRRVQRDVARLHARGEFWHRLRGAPWDDQQPLLHYGVGGPVYQQTKLQRRELTAMLRPFWNQLVMHRAGNSLWLEGGVLVDFVSGDRPDSIPGVGWDGTWWTEAARLKADVFDDAIFSRLTGKPGRSEGWFIGDTTPKGRNWFWSRLARRADPNDEPYDPEFALHHWTTADNIRSPAAQRQAERAKIILPWRYYRRDFLANFDAFQGQVWDNWERRVHVVPASAVPSSFARVVVGVDWGYRNPGVLLAVGLTGDGDLYAFRECHEAGVQVRGTGETWVGRAKDWLREIKASRFACDPSATGNLDAFREAGLPVVAADNEVDEGIRRVAVRLSYRGTPDLVTVRPRLFVSERCQNTIREIEGYHYHPRRDGGHSEEPEKVDDHGCDALRYAVAEFDVKRGDVAAVAYEPATPVQTSVLHVSREDARAAAAAEIARPSGSSPFAPVEADTDYGVGSWRRRR